MKRENSTTKNAMSLVGFLEGSSGAWLSMITSPGW